MQTWSAPSPLELELEPLEPELPVRQAWRPQERKEALPPASAARQAHGKLEPTAPAYELLSKQKDVPSPEAWPLPVLVEDGLRSLPAAAQ